LTLCRVYVSFVLSFNFLVAFVRRDCTSVGIGALNEHGLFVTNQGEAIQENQYSWNKGAANFYNLIYNLLNNDLF